MIFWIGFTLMALNEGFVMMRHVSPFFDKLRKKVIKRLGENLCCLLYTSPSPRDRQKSRMPSSA